MELAWLWHLLQWLSWPLIRYLNVQRRLHLNVLSVKHPEHPGHCKAMRVSQSSLTSGVHSQPAASHVPLLELRGLESREPFLRIRGVCKLRDCGNSHQMRLQQEPWWC